MTYKERLQKEHPEKISKSYCGGCHGCPANYGYGPENMGNTACLRHDTCADCWYSECEDTEKTKTTFAKSDIKPCFLLELRNGHFREVYSVGKDGTFIAASAGGDWDYLSAWDDNFNYKKGTFEARYPRKGGDKDKDVVKVYGWVEGTKNYSRLDTNYNHDNRPILWQRTEVKKMTVAEINAALGYEVEIVAEKE